MAMTEFFDFPVTVSKYELTQLYGISYRILRQFIGDELAEELNWKHTRTFSPEQTRKIFLKLSTTRYREFEDRNRKKVEEIKKAA